MDEKPEQSPDGSGDGSGEIVAHDTDLWVPAADDPLFGPLRSLPSSIRRPAPEAGGATAADSVHEPFGQQPAVTAAEAVAAAEAIAPRTAVTGATRTDDARGASLSRDPDGAAGGGGTVPSDWAAGKPGLLEEPPMAGHRPPADAGPDPAVGTIPASGRANPTPPTGPAPATAAGPATGSATSSSPSPPGSSPRRYPAKLVVAAGILTMALFALAVILMSGGGEQDSPSVAPAHPIPVADPDFINSVRTDSDPVTAQEFFSATKVTLDLRSYTRIAHDLVSGCEGLTGELAAALSKGQCRQLVRAVYVSEPDTAGRRVLAATSVLVLDDASTARASADLVREGKGSVPALPVPAESLPGVTVADPTGDNSWRTAHAGGHYLIVIRLAYTDGSEGSATDTALATAGRDLAVLASQPIAQRALVRHGPR